MSSRSPELTRRPRPTRSRPGWSDGADLDRFVARRRPITDADAEPSPAPPPDVFMSLTGEGGEKKKKKERAAGLQDVVAWVRLLGTPCAGPGCVPRRPAWKSSNAWTSSALVFITNGP